MDFSPVKKLTIGEILERNARLVPDKKSVVFGSCSYTYKELNEAVDALCQSLYSLGIRKGDRIALNLPNWPEFIVSYFAAAKIGAVIVPLNTKLRENEVAYILNNAEVSTVITADEFAGIELLGMFSNLKSRIPSLKNIVVVGKTILAGMLKFSDLVSSQTSAIKPKISVEQSDLFTILYTSGTTGNPKGAMLTHYNFVMVATGTAELLECSEQDKFLIAVPVFHVFGMCSSILSCIASQGTAILMDTFKAEEALKVIEKERVTVHHGVPTMFILELNNPNFQKYDLSSLRTGIIAAAPCPVEIVKRIRKEMGCNICVSYGLTETSAGLTITRFDAPDILRAETVGQPFPGVEIKIVDEERNTLPSGEAGELACRSIGLMQGYYCNSEATAQAIDSDGWFYTGDLATIDEQGYVRIVGRKKEMIIRGGFKIYPREVEEVLYAHPAVQEVAVVGLPNPVLGEINCACIKLKDGAVTNDGEIVDFCRGKLVEYKLPDKVLFRDELPMTPSGKIKKIELKEQLLSS